LQGYWQWHHAKGLQRGDFDSPAGLLRRIAEVNFGIFRYRFDLDRVAGRSEYLGLDAAIAWVFCALDLRFYARRHQAPVSVNLFDEAGLGAGVELEADVARALELLLAAIDGGVYDTAARKSWQDDYVATFQRLLIDSGWVRDCAGGGAGWSQILREEGVCV
jgi:hypothetical protein